MNLPRNSHFYLVLLAASLVGCRPPVRPPVNPPSPPSPSSAVSVLTQHNNSMRTGANLLETQLTPATVANGMKLLYSRPVSGVLTAQLLYVHGVKVNSQTRNVIYAFTEDNNVFAYDADEQRDSGTSRGLLWQSSLPVTKNPVLSVPAEGQQVGGILSTPVIDDSAGRLYLVYAISNGLLPANGSDSGNPPYQVEFHLAALDIRSGTVLGDVLINGSVSSSVPPGHVDFVASRATQRAGLLLLTSPVNNKERIVYVAFGGRFNETTFNYHGWVMGYESKTLAPRGVFCSTPDRQANDNGGGIWQGGGGLAGDESGNVYFNTGNGPASAIDHGNSIVRLTLALRPTGNYDFDVQAFSAEADDPAHAAAWEDADIDLGAGGVTLIPGSKQLVSGGKTGVLYLLNCTTMKKVISFDAFSVNAADDPDPVGARYRDWGHGPHLHGGWTYWAVSPNQGYVYHWAEKDFLRRFNYDPVAGNIDPAIVKAGDVLAKPFPVMPAGLVSLSANATANGVLWATLPWDGGGRIMAFDATTLGRIWDTTAPGGATSHNAPPTVADGKVIVGTQNATILVYGLSSPPTPAAAAKSQAVASPRTATAATSATSSEVTLPRVADPSPWVREYLRRLAPDQAAILTPPKGNRPLFLGTTGQASSRYCSGAGSLTYEVRSPDTATSPQWVLAAVSGDLCDDTGVMPHMAYRGLGQTLATAQPGLAWQIAGGGVVRWSVKASVNAPQPADAPWVLFSSEGSGGRDLLDQITYVQLLGTVGGAPPASVGQLGEQVKVPYTGRYVFYVRDSGTPNPPAPPQ